MQRLLFSGLLLLMLFSSCEKKPRMVSIETSYGTMKIVLYDETPLHRDNFIKLAEAGYYNDLLFHRIVNGFMIQGGDPDSKDAPQGKVLGQGGPGYTIPAEIGALHFKGALSAARLGGPQNPHKESSGSQFYIVQGKPVSAQNLAMIGQQKKIQYSPEQIALYEQIGGTPQLDQDYTVFGEVVEGLEIIDQIAATPVQGERPKQDVKMTVKVIR